MTIPKINLDKYRTAVEENISLQVIGKVTQVVGLTLEVKGIDTFIGEVCEVYFPGEKKRVLSEVVGFRNNSTLLMPLGETRGIGPGCRVIPTGQTLKVSVSPYLLGKVLDGLGRTLNGKLPANEKEYPVDNQPPNPLTRTRINRVLETGVRAIDGLLTCGQGQRLGIFSGSGVGKSTLLGMIAKNSSADVNVIALIGERGREVGDFLEKDLGEGLERSVVVVVTSDQPALVRVKGALVATTIAEYFRDQGKNVMLMMDSATRLAMAQREIGLAIGEPPTTKGYTPSVFAFLPKLLERSGTSSRGSITGLYTVLVDGDDLDEPISDAIRGILDGHIVLSRRLAAKNHYPSIDVLRSVSRLMTDLVGEPQKKAAGKLKEILATYEEAEDLINIGAYAEGSNPKIDYALRHLEDINKYLRQDTDENSSYEQACETLMEMLQDQEVC